jgi:predicted NBD/HSP70 family sugar kinase
LADASFARKARAVAAACLQLAGVYAVEAVALGGGVIDARTELVDAARRDLEEMRGSVAPAPLRVEKAALSSNRAGAIGAALLAMARSHRADSLSADA